MSKLVLGSYVIYKQAYYVALGYDGKLVKLINPTLSNMKRNVSTKHLSKTDVKCNEVMFEGNPYLVTLRDTIISLTTNKVMKWSDEHREREGILIEAHSQRLAA
jgi:hypothetical protein